MFTIFASLLLVCISFPDVDTQGDGHPRDTRLLLDGERTLVDQVAALTNKVTALTNKVAALEAKDNTGNIIIYVKLFAIVCKHRSVIFISLS